MTILVILIQCVNSKGPIQGLYKSKWQSLGIFIVIVTYNSVSNFVNITNTAQVKIIVT